MGISTAIKPEYPDRVMAKNGSAAIALRKRTLTKLYNMRGTAAGAWLDDLHRKLDEAVAATAQTGAASTRRMRGSGNVGWIQVPIVGVRPPEKIEGRELMPGQNAWKRFVASTEADAWTRRLVDP